MNKHLEDTKKKLDSVSPSFCIAKWKQVTIHLQTGMTHSCHHPSPHKIPIQEINEFPSALHNTNFKKEQRKSMLSGVRPKECDYCWKVEDTGAQYSERHYKSSQNWATPYFDETKNLTGDENVFPSYMEVSFSNACNLKCSYCSPLFSSKWMEEIKEHGAYPTSSRFNNLEWFESQQTMPIPEREDNPYVNAFWKWWPEAYGHLDEFRITGGEPLMTKHTFKFLDYFIENIDKNPNLRFSINTNLCVPDEILNKFIEKMEILQEKSTIMPKIFTSVDGWEDRAAYIRHGMEFEKFHENLRKVLGKLERCNLTFMSTFNALSVTSFKEFLENVKELKQEFANDYRPHGVFVDIPYLRHPQHQSIKILTDDYQKYVKSMVDYMEDSEIFYDFEIDRMNRIFQLIKVPEDENMLQVWRSDFYKFFVEHDKRRGTNFLQTFPEMEDFWLLCKEASK